MVLTEWHKQHMLERYPFLKKERMLKKIVITGNGIDPARFKGSRKKNPKKVIYSSSPDRGLDVILEGIWPLVLEKVPDAELHIYYGWDSFDKFASIPGWGHLVEFKNKVQQLFLNSKNVTQHGRISQEQLAIEMQEAAIWLYPTYFTETYCITAVEAQLAGAIPVTNHLAGLADTVKSGVILEGDVRDPEVQKKYAEMTINLLTMEKNERENLHKLVKKNAPRRSWDDIAKQWEESVIIEGVLARG